MKMKMRIAVFSSIAFLVTVMIVFVNIPFDVDFVYVDKFIIDEYDFRRGDYPKWNIITRDLLYLIKNDGKYVNLWYENYTYEEITKNYGEYDILEIVKNHRDSIHEFNIYVDEFDFTDYYLVYTNTQPIKKVTFKYNYYLRKLWNYIGRYTYNYYHEIDISFVSPFEIWNDNLGIDVKFDENVGYSDYFYVYKIRKNQK